jgi:exodeoxyribonuclease VII large subunit
MTRAWRRRLAGWVEGLDWAQRRLSQLHPAVQVEQQLQRLDELELRLGAAVRGGLLLRSHGLAARRAELVSHSPQALLSGIGRRLDVMAARLMPALAARVEQSRSRFGGLARALHAFSPLATLERGYAIVALAADGRVIRDAGEAAPGSEIEARLARGRLRARVLPEAE